MTWHLNTGFNESWAWNTCFSDEECDQIIELGLSEPLETGLVEEEEKQKTRNSKTRFLLATDPKHRWIYERCTSAVHKVNSEHFKFDLEYIQDLQFSCYDEETPYYAKHIDNLYHYAGLPRKLSFTIQLSNPENYEGGELTLYLNEEDTVLDKKQGMSLFFPSSTLHEVKPVTKGTRYSLVGWVAGPRFK
jgi:PKHD-type hydroxylase